MAPAGSMRRRDDAVDQRVAEQDLMLEPMAEIRGQAPFGCEIQEERAQHPAVAAHQLARQHQQRPSARLMAMAQQGQELAGKAGRHRPRRRHDAGPDR